MENPKMGATAQLSNTAAAIHSDIVPPERSNLERALAFADIGLAVFPCRPREETNPETGEVLKAKTPLTPHGFHDATTDEDVIRGWWGKRPDALPAIPTGKVNKLVVLDLDRKNGEDGITGVQKVGLNLPITHTQPTPSNGEHRFFRYPPGVEKIASGAKLFKNLLGIKKTGIDIRGDGGYVIAWGDISLGILEELEEWPTSEFDEAFRRDDEAGQFQRDQTHTQYSTRPDDIERAKTALEFIPADDRDEWLKIGMALKSAFGNSGRETWDKWSRKSTKFNDHDQDKAWQSFKRDGIGIATLFDIAKQNGYHPNGKDPFSSGPSGGFSGEKEGSHGTAKSAKSQKWREPQALPDGLPPVDPFDFDLLPDPLRGWCEDIVSTMQAPPDYAGVTIMTALGAVIGRKIGIRPQQNTAWTEVANQWGVLVGRPGVLKSPTIDACLAPLKARAAIAMAAFKEDKKEYELEAKIAEMRAQANREAAKKALSKNSSAVIDGYLQTESEDKLTLRRYITSDATPEALAQLLIENPNGVLVHRDEVVSLLQGFDREDRVEGRGFYLSGWNGNSEYTSDRIIRGMNLHIPGACISILGSTQPGKIARYLASAVHGGSGDDGLIQRFGMMVWPDVSPAWEDVDRPLNAESKRAAFNVFNTLDEMNPLARGAKQDVGFDGENEGIPYLRFDNEAQEIFREWRAKLELQVRSGELHPALESHFGKYRKLVPGLALILHLANGNHGAVNELSILTALVWAGYLETHARRAYASVTMVETTTAKAIAAKIKGGELKDDFSSRDVWRPGWSMLTDVGEVQKGLDLLVDLDWLDVRQEHTGGRPRTIYSINPRLQS
jgi:putative DNA primase/helicase